MIAHMKDRGLGKHYLREWRQYRGLSLRKLADRMETEPGVPFMSHANIDRVEKGMQPYTQELLEAAALALDTTVPDLLSVDPRMEDALAQLNALLRLADRDQKQMALEMVKVLITGSKSA